MPRTLPAAMRAKMIKPGEVRNPLGRAAGTLNVATVFRNEVMSKLTDVVKRVFSKEKFIIDFEAQVMDMAARDPIKALQATRFLWPAEVAVSGDVPADVFRMSADRLKQVAQAVVTSASAPALTEAQTSDCNGLRRQNAQDAEFSVVDNGANKSQV